MQCELKTLLSKIKKVSPEHIFLGNGSDEAIDLVFRAFCEPGKDNVVAIDPTYGMYQVCADGLCVGGAADCQTDERLSVQPFGVDCVGYRGQLCVYLSVS